MACRLGNKLSVIVIHAKEAKNESVIKVQAAYAAAMIKLVPAPAVVCADMNTKSRDFAGIFAANVVSGRSHSSPVSFFLARALSLSRSLSLPPPPPPPPPVVWLGGCPARESVMACA